MLYLHGIIVFCCSFAIFCISVVVFPYFQLLNITYNTSLNVIYDLFNVGEYQEVRYS